MSNTSVYAASQSQRSERRRDARHSVAAPVYLDVGGDNGGILLNVSEQGIGFVAIAPLSGQGKVTVRIQFASARPQIETSAQIVWFDRSSRQAGVRFVSMSPQLRAQVHDWIASEVALSPPEAESLEQQPVVREPQPKQESAPPDRDELASLIEPSLLDAGATSPSAGPNMETSIAEPLEHYDVASFENPATGPAERGQLAVEEDSIFADPAVREVGHQPESRSERDEPHPSAALSAPTLDHPAILDWPIPSSRMMPPPAPIPSTEALETVQLPAFDHVSRPTIAVDDAPVLPTRPEAEQVKKWIWAVAILAGFSILCLCFAVGIWVGSHRRQSIRATATSEPSKVESTEVENISSGARHLAAPVSNKVRGAPNDSGRKPEREKRMPQPAPASQQDPAPPIQVPQSLPLQQAVAVSASTPPVSTTPAERAPTPASPSPDSALAAPAPRIVAGRPLKLTDRFNPCHLTYRVEPAYPPEARERRVEGAVRIHQIIGTDGAVRSVKLLDGPVELAPAALDAARYWRYLPAMLNGQPVETDQDIEIEFRLPH